jgi:hypothetical protein
MAHEPQDGLLGGRFLFLRSFRGNGSKRFLKQGAKQANYALLADLLSPSAERSINKRELTKTSFCSADGSWRQIG